MAALSWIDAASSCRLRSNRPGPFLDRFAGWVPMSRTVGVREENPFTGAVTVWRYRTDYGVSFELPGIRPYPTGGTLPVGESPLVLADRLQQHLVDGGLVTVETENVAGTTYVCRLMSGTEPQLTLVDPRTLEYSLRLALVNVAAGRFYFPW